MQKKRKAENITRNYPSRRTAIHASAPVVPEEFYKELGKLEVKFGINRSDLIALASSKERTELKENIPICVFKTRKLSSLECVVKYLRENRGLNFREIGELVNRSKFTIASSYRSAKSKLPGRFSVKYSEMDIPVDCIANRKLSTLENIVFYLKSKFGMKYCSIAKMLCLDQRTIWTVYSRALKKKKKKLPRDGKKKANT